MARNRSLPAACLAGLLTAALSGATLSSAILSSAEAADQITFGTNWKAQAEHGGFYQAIATGIYERYGLDVTIRPGGPQVNHAQLLAAGKLDFYMGGNLFGQFNFTNNDIPMITVAAIFQKEPQVLIAHPDQGIDSLDDLQEKTLIISKNGELTYWNWLKEVYGLKDEQIKPYTFNPAPFLADTDSVQQGYITSEPFAIEQQGGFKPDILVLADAGYDTYATTIVTAKKRVDENADLVQRFVDASIEGWYAYLYGNPAPGNALIKQDNPDMTDDQIAYSIATMKAHGIVDSGDSLKSGIGAMSDERWRSFFEKTVGWGLFPADMPYQDGYTLDFVNRSVGMDLKN